MPSVSGDGHPGSYGELLWAVSHLEWGALVFAWCLGMAVAPGNSCGIFGLCLPWLCLGCLSWLPQPGLGLGRVEEQEEQVPGGAQRLGLEELWGLFSQWQPVERESGAEVREGREVGQNRRGLGSPREPPHWRSGDPHPIR